MKRVLALLLVCLNTACMTDPNAHIEAVAPARAARPTGDQAVVVLGISLSNPARSELFGKASGGGANWIAFDPRTGLRNNSVLLSTGASCDLLGRCEGIGTVLYQSYLLEPGSYAMAFAASSLGLYLTNDRADGQAWAPCAGVPIDAAFKTARPQPIAPSFTAQAGEVLYVGNLTFDFSRRGWAGWSFSLDEAAARAALAPSALGDRLITRPLMRIDGTPINATDGAPSRSGRCDRVEVPIFIPGKH
jgi:hypothetical protein